jgi:hypothetical protein
MNPNPDGQTRDHATSADVAALEEHLRCRLAGRARDLQLVITNQGLVLRGRARTYYAKQLAQQVVLAGTSTAIAANEIEVS